MASTHACALTPACADTRPQPCMGMLTIWMLRAQAAPALPWQPLLSIQAPLPHAHLHMLPPQQTRSERMSLSLS